MGLSESGGGIATAARLLLSCTREWARHRAVELRVLTLGTAVELPSGVDGYAFDGDRLALARAVWKAQFRDGYVHHIYDFLGVARIQGMLPHRLRARYLLYLWGIEVWRPLAGSRRRALTGASARLACSRYTIDRLERHNPWAPEVEPLHLAAEADSPPRAVDAAVLERVGHGFLLIVGRMESERYKGHDSLLEALAAIATIHPNVRLVIAGEGRDRPRLERRARELGVAAHVVFAGFVDAATLAELYRRCSVFAMPSSDEGFGLVYLEAMRAGKACIALAGSAAAEIVVDGETGRLVEPGIESLTRVLLDLIGDPAGTAAMGRAGRERWRRLFQPVRFATEFRAHLDALVAEAR